MDKFTPIGWQTASIQTHFLSVEGKQRQNLAYEENETGTIGIPDAARYEFQVAGGIYRAAIQTVIQVYFCTINRWCGDHPGQVE